MRGGGEEDEDVVGVRERGKWGGVGGREEGEGRDGVGRGEESRWGKDLDDGLFGLEDGITDNLLPGLQRM